MKKLYGWICAAEAVIASAFLVAMVMLIFSSGIMRMAGWPINWAGDFATALFAWACFLCADIAWRRNSLMSIEALTSRMPPALQRACRFFNYLVITAFLLYVAAMGLWLSWISRARSFQGMPEVSYSWVTMSMPVGALLLLISTGIKLRDEIAGRAPQANTAADVM
ncbi:MAG: TRAP transporter small permease subunit [Burkholderiaceae bacterium]